MGLPTKPTLDYSYTAFQQSQGDNAFPGTEIDNDHANLKLSIDETIDFLTGSFRSDGVLKASAYPGASDLNEYVGTATAAAVSATASEVAAVAALDAFTDLYLGAKAADPALDNDGAALQDGALYWNTVAKEMRAYDLGGAAWITLLADMPEATFKMRAAGAGTGAPIDGTTIQATTALGLPVNVLTQGADPTGVADSYAAFVAAKTAAGSRGTIIVPAGTYSLSASVNSGQYIWIKEGAVTLTGVGASAGLPFVVREFGSSDGVADGFYSGPDNKWINTQFTSLTGRAGAATVSELVGVSHWGNVGTLGASRTSDSTTAAAESSIGVFGVVLNDNATQVQVGYGFYVDAYRASGAGTTFGGEIDIINVGSVVQVAPNAMFPVGATSALRLASGGGVAGATTASSALEILDNTKKFAKGIVFKQTALTGTDGLDGDTGTAIAIAMGKGMGLQWYNNAGSQTAHIYSTCHSTGVATGILFAETAFNVVGTSDGRSLLQVEATASAANRAVIRPAATGGVLEYSVAGDTNASMKLEPAGTGTVYVGSAAIPSGRPTNAGRLMLVDYGALASDSGLEFQSASSGGGYGWKVVTPDEGGGSTPLIFGARQASAAWTERGRMDARGDFVWGTAALATGATNGFVWIPSCAGAPSGAPTSPYTNAAALIADTTNSRLYVRVGATWKYAALT